MNTARYVVSSSKDDDETQNYVNSALCGLLHQTFLHKHCLIEYAQPAVDENGEGIQQGFEVS